MSADESNFDIELYEEFEAEYLKRTRFWRAPASRLRGTVLYDLFERFAEAFPDHPSETNTVFYLTELTGVSPLMQAVLLWCDHFEQSGQEDLRKLVAFIDMFSERVSEYEDMAGVDLLDGVRGRVVLRFHEPSQEVVSQLKGVGLRRGAV